MMAVILHDRVYVVLPDGAESGAIRAVSAGLRRLLRPASPPPAPPTSQASHHAVDESGGGGNVSVTINEGGGGDGADSPHRESSDGGGGGVDVPPFELAALEVLLEVVCSDLAARTARLVVTVREALDALRGKVRHGVVAGSRQLEEVREQKNVLNEMLLQVS